jgi:hypothetical protein
MPKTHGRRKEQTKMKSRQVRVSVLVATLLLVSLAAPISADISPPTLTAELAPGESIDETIEVYIPAAPSTADVIFSFDLTTSMGGIIDTAKSKAAAIIASLDAIPTVDIQYGVMSFVDYPHSYEAFCGYPAAPYGVDGDYAYSLDQAVTGDSAAVINAINALTLGTGGDDPEDYTRIMYESYTDPSVGWRGGAKRVLVNFGDSVPHDCDLNQDVPGQIGTWSTGGDPGPDEIMDTADDLDLQSVLLGMQGNGITLLECHTSNVGQVGDDPVNFETYWTYWTGLTGGGFYITGSDTLVDDIVAAVLDGLGVSTVYDLHLEVSPGFESWLWSVTPESYPEVPAGTTVPFAVTVGVPEGTPDGEYSFAISAVDGVGANYGDQQVTITVVSGQGQPPIADANGPYQVAVNATITLDGSASDPDGDPLSYMWTATAGTFDDPTLEDPAYTAGSEPGIFELTFTATDPSGLSDTDSTTVTVVGLGGGFVTGGGWIYSEPGNYAPDPMLEGKATFGFVSKYKKGASIPTGETEFQFHTAGLNFHSTRYDWLTVDQAAMSAQFMGSGTINGAGAPNGQDYRLMLWAGDGDPDTFRIKIWWEDGGAETVIFDNGTGQALNSGSIVIHKGK